MERNGDFPRLVHPLLGTDVGELEQSRRSPFLDHPVRCFEIGLSANAAQLAQMMRCEEQVIVELILVDEQIRRESQVCVERTTLAWRRRVGRETYLESRM